MLGKVVFVLRAQAAGKLGMFPGNQLHGALFHLLAQQDAVFSARLHAAPDKPFAMTPLFQGQGVGAWPSQLGAAAARQLRPVQAGQYWYWRVTALNQELLQHLQAVPCGSRFVVNDIPWELAACCTMHDEHPEAGELSEQDLRAAVAQLPDRANVQLTFLTPATFRHMQLNYPWPDPRILFPSLASRWARVGLTPLAWAGQLEFCQHIVPNRWRGESVHIRFDQHKQYEGFVGSFSYNLQLLTAEQRQQIRLLAWFASLAGVGRMTAHGLGVVSCK